MLSPVITEGDAALRPKIGLSPSPSSVIAPSAVKGAIVTTPIATTRIVVNEKTFVAVTSMVLFFFFFIVIEMLRLNAKHECYE